MNMQYDLIKKYRSFESPLVPKLGTLQKIRSEYNKLQNLDENIFKSLRILNHKFRYNNSIKELNIYPHFITTFSSELQDTLLRKLKKKTLVIDATGSLCMNPKCSEIKQYDVEMYTPKLLFYVAQVYNSDNPAFPLTQLITENQSANTIKNWLNNSFPFKKMYPEEVIIDFSPGLLSAVALSFY